MVLVTKDEFQGTYKTGQGDGTDKSSGNRSREGEMIIVGRQGTDDMPRWYSACQDIMNGLNVERLLDFGIGGSQMMKLHQKSNETRQGTV
jgi:hypothetical protein